ncbi:hypothetical protein [Modestobacter sp. Leaf380]|uniref:hypothetical protein n=1 Tax=Modestobacter sp. Leaf380 TaxID=1736356 RepID=UPI0012F76C26|nr:hypothetical protein [Modestobacter sp. Leaf380]
MFLTDPPPSAAADALYAEDVADHGHVMALSRVWAHRPELQTGLVDLLAAAGAGLTLRQRGLLVTAAAAAREDGYCALAWGTRLAAAAGDDVAVAALTAEDAALGADDRALVRFARQAARDPNGTTAADVQALREAGLDEAAVLSLTVFVALRVAFATVNGALGAAPDPELAAAAPAAVRDAVRFGRPAGG